MAFLILKNRQKRFITAEQGATIWRIMNKEMQGTKAQQAFTKQVYKVYLSRQNAPESYKRRYFPASQLAIQARLPYKD